MAAVSKLSISRFLQIFKSGLAALIGKFAMEFQKNITNDNELTKGEGLG